MSKKLMTMDFITNALISREALFSQLSSVGKDINGECGYPDTISVQDYRDMYDREGIATRVVEVLPQESWATDPEITENEESEETTFEIAVSDLDDEQRLFHYLARVDEMSGIGAYGVLLLGINDGKELSKPVNSVLTFKKPDPEPVEKPEPVPKQNPKEIALERKDEKTPGEPPTKSTDTVPLKQVKEMEEEASEPAEEFESEVELLYMRVFDQKLADISTYEKDPKNPRFGQPTMYNITFADENTSQGITSVADSTQKQVHWTRVIHFADNRKSSEVFGVPRQRPVFNRLVDLRKLLGGSAEMFWKGAFPGYSFEVTGDAAEIEIDAESMRLEFEKYSAGLQRYLALAGVSAKSLAPQVANPQQHVQAELEAIAITLGVPVRIFTGSEQAHLAATTDETTWNRRVARRRKNYLSPYVIRPLFDRLMAMGILPPVAKYKVDWEDLNAPSDGDKAEVVGKLTEALAKYIAGSVDQIIPPREYLTGIMDMDPEEVDEILKAAEVVIAEEELKEDEEREAMQERAEAMGMEAQSISKEGGASFGQPAPPSMPPQGAVPGAVPPKSKPAKKKKKPTKKKASPKK